MVIHIRNTVYVDLSHYLVNLYGKIHFEHSLDKAYLHISVEFCLVFYKKYDSYCFSFGVSLYVFPLGCNRSLQEIHGT